MAKIALLIGVSEYEPGLNTLPSAVEDVKAMRRVLSQSEVGGFDQVSILKNPQPLEMQIEIQQTFSPSCKKNDLVLLFFSGHGVKDERRNLYLATRLTRKTERGDLIKAELEPTFNELNAIDRVQKKNWSLIFAPPGLAAIAIDKQQYVPIFPLQSLPNERSVIVVKQDSSVQNLSDLKKNKIIALGIPSSATGYYLPLYDLYGLTLAEIRFASNPKTILEWLDQNQVDAGVISEDEFQRYRLEFLAENEFRLDRQQLGYTKFRIIHKTRPTPSGVVLLSPKVDFQQKESIIKAMKQAHSSIVTDVGYLPDGKIPDYKEFIIFVKKVQLIDSKIREKPAALIIENNQ